MLSWNKSKTITRLWTAISILDQGWKLDFGRFLIYLRQRFYVTKAYLFIGYVAGNERLYQSLEEAGYVVIFKPTLIHDGSKVKGNVDAELVLHAMIQYDSYEQAVIVTGDGDFHCLIEYLLEQGKLKRLVVPNKGKYSSLLRKFSRHISFLNGTKEKLEFRK